LFLWGLALRKTHQRKTEATATWSKLLDLMKLRAALVGLCLLGCASGPRHAGAPEDYGFVEDSQIVWVRGPWEVIRPSEDVDEVIDQLCPAVMALPGARLGAYGQEYCGVIYSFEDGLYYASVPSTLKKAELVGPSNWKSCFSPAVVKDSRGQLQASCRLPQPSLAFLAFKRAGQAWAKPALSRSHPVRHDLPNPEARAPYP
jgi:hypothetical protein